MSFSHGEATDRMRPRVSHVRMVSYYRPWRPYKVGRTDLWRLALFDSQSSIVMVLLYALALLLPAVYGGAHASKGPSIELDIVNRVIAPDGFTRP